MRRLSVGDCIRYGWETFKQRPWILIGCFLLAMLINVLPGFFEQQPEIGPDGQPMLQPITVLGAAMLLLSIAVSFLVGIGLTTLALRAHDNIATVEVTDLWNPAPF